jgi:hypothetical protein
MPGCNTASLTVIQAWRQLKVAIEQGFARPFAPHFVDQESAGAVPHADKASVVLATNLPGVFHLLDTYS